MFCVFGRSNGICTVSCTCSGCHDCVCQAGVISNKVAFSFCTLWLDLLVQKEGNYILLDGSKLFEKHPFSYWMDQTSMICMLGPDEKFWKQKDLCLEAATPPYCLKNFWIELLFDWVSHCSRLEIGCFVENTRKVFCYNCAPFDQKVVPNLFAYIWENFIVSTLHLY